MEFSRLLPVRQRFPDRRLPNVAEAVARTMAEASLAMRLRPGSRVAIGVGSRGIQNLPVIVRAVVDYWRAHGMQPFLFPAMGSHGAATAAGQAQVLADFGVTEAAMGCPVRSSLEVVSLGTTPSGIETVLDREAFSSDGIFLVSRVKWHTSFSGKLESGLFKMMAIGLGKLAGAQRYHTHAYRMGMEHVIRQVGRQVLATGKMLGGLAVLEGAQHETGLVEAVPAGTLEAREEELLALVKTWMPRLPVSAVDVLILDQFGKEISGTGMDTKVVNRSIRGQYNPYPDLPRIARIFVRRLTAETHGNAVGIGMADVVHDRVLTTVDWPKTWVNSLTASTPSGSRLPVHFPSDQECLERIAMTVGKLHPEEVTFAWLRDTLSLSELWLSENLRSQITQNQMLDVVGGPVAWPWDAQTDLDTAEAPWHLSAAAV